MKINKYNLIITDDGVPYELEDNFYYSRRDGTVMFACPCGCGNKEILWVNEEGIVKHGPQSEWSITVHDKDNFTLKASVLSGHPCKSHYFITNSKVQWC